MLRHNSWEGGLGSKVTSHWLLSISCKCPVPTLALAQCAPSVGRDSSPIVQAFIYTPFLPTAHSMTPFCVPPSSSTPRPEQAPVLPWVMQQHPGQVCLARPLLLTVFSIAWVKCLVLSQMLSLLSPFKLPTSKSNHQQILNSKSPPMPTPPLGPYCL